jgi:hypothetical protein
MSASNRFLSVAILGLCLVPAPLAAVENLGGHFRDPTEFREVIDARCIGCHDRERIEQARRRQEALEPLMRRMTGHGAVLSQKEREVLGTFWGSPLQEKK